MAPSPSSPMARPGVKAHDSVRPVASAPDGEDVIFMGIDG